MTSLEGFTAFVPRSSCTVCFTVALSSHSFLLSFLKDQLRSRIARACRQIPEPPEAPTFGDRTLALVGYSLQLGMWMALAFPTNSGWMANVLSDAMA